MSGKNIFFNFSAKNGHVTNLVRVDVLTANQDFWRPAAHSAAGGKNFRLKSLNILETINPKWKV